MNSLYPGCMQFNLRYFKTKTLLLVFFFSFSFISSYSQGHVFQNAKLESGRAGADRAVYRFPNAKPGIDALVTIKGRSDSKVSLVSMYYIIERSNDGRNFTEAGRVDAGINSENRKDYSFSDHAAADDGMIYYRLKNADLDGRRRLSDVRTVRVANSTAAIAFNTFPNPVVRNLNITLPANWSGRKVCLNIYNVNGIIVKQRVTEAASKTETIEVSYLQPGI